MSKQKKYDISADPNREAEAKKYDDPIPSREIILEFFKDKGVPVTFDATLKALNLSSESHRQALKRRLRAMERDGQLLYNRGGYYGLVSKMDLLKGTVMASKDGTGEVIDKAGRLIYLPMKQMRGVFHGDTVLVRPSGVTNRGYLEGTLAEVLVRNTEKLTGRYHREFDVPYVVPINPLLKHDVLIYPQNGIEVKPGQFVVVEIISQPTYRTQPLGKIIEVIGDQLSIDEAISMAVKSYDLPDVWSDKLVGQTKRIGKEVQASDLEGRHDLRHLPFVTIDGEDAKDFDDAVFCEAKKSGGWRLYVAIADVSYYVRPDSELDKEAKKRSTSVYFPGHVIPMLPEALSNELCSLKPKVDRLTLVCEMTVSSNGKLSGYKFYSAVIHSHARLTYTEVAQFLDETNTQFQKKYSNLVKPIYTLYGMYLALKAQREARGAIDFDMTETQIELNEHNEIQAIIPRDRNDAHRIIEECMLLANVSAARFVIKHKKEGVFRVHATPASSKITTLKDYLRVHGLKLEGGDDPKPIDFSNMLKQAEGREDYNNIQLVTLRSMSQAVYSPNNEGHFGLAYPAYSHFTSPIRRYPDLLTHRIIRKILNEPKLGAYEYQQQKLVDLCDHASMAERRSDSAAQSVEDWLKCAFMQHRVGEIFEAKIVNVIGIGFFVSLIENSIEGLVHVATMEGDYYHYDQARQILIGERTRKIFGLGQAVKVKLLSVNMNNLKIDFELVEAKPLRSKSKRPKKRKNQNKQAHQSSPEEIIKEIVQREKVRIKELEEKSKLKKKEKKKAKKKLRKKSAKASKDKE